MERTFYVSVCTNDLYSLFYTLANLANFIYSLISKQKGKKKREETVEI